MRNPRLYISGILILTVSFWAVRLCSIYPPFIDAAFIKIFLINVFILFISAEITDKYKRKFRSYDYCYIITPYCKSVFCHLILFYLVPFFYAIPTQVKQNGYQSIILSYFIELMTVTIMAIAKKEKFKTYNCMVNVQLSPVDGEPDYPEDLKVDSIPLTILLDEMQGEEGRNLIELCEDVQLSGNSMLKKIENGEIRTNDASSILCLKFCDIPINYIKKVNAFLTGLHSQLKQNGFLIIKYLIPGGRGRHNISKAEMWGRLHYCGFEVIKEIEKQGECYLLSQKKRNPSKLKPSSKRILIKLRRVGYEGRIFQVYKLRTMYPYSEFIQKKIFELNQLDNTGKINKDFRITRCGKFLRKYWLDELPQLINWIKSDIKLVGIRGMSLHYFSLYPDYYQNIYLKVKPGLIPPIFDDSNSDFEVIKQEELHYLESYCASPVRTDLTYFFTTFKNIIFKNYRGR